MTKNLKRIAHDIEAEALDYHGHAHDYLVKAAHELHDAADQIEALRKEVGRLRNALMPFAKARWGNDEDGWLSAKGIQHVAVDIARKLVGA
jgi:hypothetical protein